MIFEFTPFMFSLLSFSNESITFNFCKSHRTVLTDIKNFIVLGICINQFFTI